ncbi:MAG: glycogen debranching N-terminal domain-containing protein [Candidatus Sulfotelmatobacter sp.]
MRKKPNSAGRRGSRSSAADGKRGPLAPNNVARAIVIKDEDLFLLCEKTGDIPRGDPQGFGLYYHDCRYLNGYEVTFAGSPLNALESTSESGFMAEFVLTNPELKQSGGCPLKKQSVGIHVQRIIDSAHLCVQDVITCTNYTTAPLKLPLSFSFDSDFEDVFEIRGFHPGKIGRSKKPRWRAGMLRFEYGGADGVLRELAVKITPAPKTHGLNGAEVKVTLLAGESKQVHITFFLGESAGKKRAARIASSKPDVRLLTNRLHERADDWMKSHCQMQSSSTALNNVFERSMRDLRILRTTLDSREYFSAGLPWYGALFGRDGIISSLQTLAFRPQIAEQTLRLLANYQGKEVKDWRDEEPGKIMHELRVGELAHLNEIPQTPYYGSVDSTPLFLILIARHANWGGDLSLFRELRQTIVRAFRWIDRFGNQSGNGYLEYDSKSTTGLGNQGWKDSGDAIMNADGSLAEPPIALVEVQGYVYMAKMSMAELYERDGDLDTAKRLRLEAHELQARFEGDFWSEEKSVYALALQKGNKPAKVISSNAGQVLWSRMAKGDRAKKTAERLMSPSMFSGWGVRTLSSEERRFNPVGYHLGTVWPHDNSIIAAGLRNYGFDGAACSILRGLVDAAQHFEHSRLPEVFAGFSRTDFHIPVRYPVACHPQAWAAGAVPFVLESLLGLVPRALDNGLQIVRPVLPDFISRLELQRLKVGAGTADLRFERKTDGTVRTHIIQVHGKLDIEVSAASKAA